MPEVSSHNATVESVSQRERKIDLLDLFIILAKHKKKILGYPFLVAVLVSGITLLMPDIYTATTRILPPQQQQSSAAAMIGQLGAITGMAGSTIGLKNPNDLYVGILKSRSVADKLIDRFKLQDLYKEDTLVETRMALEDVSFFNAGKDGIITIEVDDENPNFAAEMANAYVEELSNLNQNLAVTEAAQRRLFFQQQLKYVKDELSNAEFALKQTQEKTGVLQLDAQGKSLIEAVGTLRAQIAAKEVELGALRTFATEHNPDYLRILEELRGMRGQLSKLERGGDNYILPAGKLPEAGLETIRRMRELKYYESLYELLAKQYEIARVDEVKDASLIQVLDKAVPPDRKSKPKRALIVLLATVLAGVLTLVWVLLYEAQIRAEEEPEHAARLKALRRYIKA